ncbi:hypothetical protein QMP26_10605 [Enterocloster clostridioformis]|uniref:hypothetical protein n=1 Tax=Enterocloster clostridioformis TaxID=1531 RepID=UPI002674F20E|nr:hypothetical protein [Enterocloster clostridioformis]
MGKEKVYGVWAVRSGASIFGRTEGWCKEDGKPLEFDSERATQDYADAAGRHGECPLLCGGKRAGAGRNEKTCGTAGFGCPRS